MRALLLTLLLAPLVARAEEAFCDERPTPNVPASVGKPSAGRLEGGVSLEEGPHAKILPLRHSMRCLNYATPRLVQALKQAGERVQRAAPDSPPLGVGNLSRARGGPIRAYSHSHQAGRDADLAFYQVDEQGRPVPPADLTRFGPTLENPEKLRFDVRRNWLLVAALLDNPSVHVKWMFISEPLRRALLAEGRRTGAPSALLARAEQALHQPSDAPPHDDHLHLRIDCTAQERQRGCR